MIVRFFSILLCVGLFLPLFVEAQGYVSLVGIPGLEGDTRTTGGFINALYLLSISLAGFLAVGRIIFAGVKYMLTDVVTTKGAAKEDIKAALLGLVIVLGAVLVLETINPELSNLALFRNAERIEVTTDAGNECPSGSRLVVRAMGDPGSCEVIPGADVDDETIPGGVEDENYAGTITMSEAEAEEALLSGDGEAFFNAERDRINTEECGGEGVQTGQYPIPAAGATVNVYCDR